VTGVDAGTVLQRPEYREEWIPRNASGKAIQAG